MLKLPSRQALKALRNPFRNPLPNPLRGLLQTRHIHDVPAAPFSGPPSYATLARRFSASSPSPISFFAHKAAKEAIERGQWVDIHDIGGVDPNDYDVLIKDIDKDTLQSEISKIVGIPYLKEATKDEADKVTEELHGFVYGQTFRMILPCVLSIKDKARWVFFLVHSGAPLTYISTEVAQAFGLMKHRYHSDTWGAKIAGHYAQVHMAPSDSQDFCYLNKFRPWNNDKGRTVTYYIGDNWEYPKPKL